MKPVTVWDPQNPKPIPAGVRSRRKVSSHLPRFPPNACGCARRVPTPRSGLLPNHHLAFSSRLLMRQRPEPLHPFLSRCFHAYAILAILYTLGSFCTSVLRYQPRLRPTRIAVPSNMTVQQAEELLWSNFSFPGHHSLVTWDPILSRAFSRLAHPSRIIPYYYRATGVFENNDITITTLISNDRFPIFRHLVQRYRGALSLLSALPIDPRRLLRPNICYTPRIFTLPKYPSRSPHHVCVFTGLLNLRRHPSRSLPVPNV